MGAKDGPTRFPFTKQRLDALPVPEASRRRYHDEKTPGLCLVITAGGSRTFYSYRKVNGAPQEIRLGRYPETTIEQARTIAAAIGGDYAKGIDVAAQRREARKVPTLQEAFTLWLDTHAKAHKRTWKDDERQFEKYLVDFHGRRLNTIRTAEVAAWHGRIGKAHGPIQANRTLALLATVYNAADRAGYSGKNPCDGVKRFREESRDRFLRPQEMRAFFDAVQLEADTWRDYFLLLLFTGVRRSNLMAMRWGEIDFDGKVWRIPGEKFKTGRVQYVPLVPPAMRILQERRETAESPAWVFPAAGRTGHITDPRKAWERILGAMRPCPQCGEVAGAKPETCPKCKAQLPPPIDLHLHDLRRSLGSWQAAAGASIAIIGASLGHRDLKSTQVYSRLQLDAVRQSVESATTAMIAAATPKQLEAKADAEAK